MGSLSSVLALAAYIKSLSNGFAENRVKLHLRTTPKTSITDCPSVRRRPRARDGAGRGKPCEAGVWWPPPERAGDGARAAVSAQCQPGAAKTGRNGRILMTGFRSNQPRIPGPRMREIEAIRVATALYAAILFPVGHPTL